MMTNKFPNRRADLTADRLKELLSYDPDTGRFTWLANRGRQACKGREVKGTLDGFGYLMIRVDYVIYKVHRLAWLYMTGKWPTQDVDHVNHLRDDNRWANLREATARQNRWNTLQVTGRLGFRGVRLSRSGKFAAVIGIGGGRRKHLGVFPTAEKAHAAYVSAAKAAHGDFLCLDGATESRKV